MNIPKCVSFELYIGFQWSYMPYRFYLSIFVRKNDYLCINVDKL